jgi:hypothetical protein
LFCDNVTIEFHGQDQAEFKGSKFGRLYLTTHRMIFNAKELRDKMQSFSFPFVTLNDVSFLYCISIVVKYCYVLKLHVLRSEMLSTGTYCLIRRLCWIWAGPADTVSNCSDDVFQYCLKLCHMNNIIKCLHSGLQTLVNYTDQPPLWSSGHSSWLQIQRSGLDSRPDFLRSSGPGTGSSQPREYNWGATWKKINVSGLQSREYGRRDPSSLPCGTLYLKMLALTSLTSIGRSVFIVWKHKFLPSPWVNLTRLDSVETEDCCLSGYVAV